MKELPRDKDKILEIFRCYNFRGFRCGLGEVKLEDFDCFLILIDAYCDKKQGKGEYYVIWHGTPETPPKEAHKCPDCGQYAERFDFRKYNLPPELMTLGNYCRLCGGTSELPNVPTFYCIKCGCEWQWAPELPEEPELGTPITPEVHITPIPDEPVKMSFFGKVKSLIGI